MKALLNYINNGSNVMFKFSLNTSSQNILETTPIKNANWWTKWKRQTMNYERRLTSAEKNTTTLLYLISLAILTAGASYAAVPLYRMFCAATSYGGTTKVGHDTEKVEAMEPKKERLLTIKFTADTAATMQWNFKPQQDSINVFAGETALAFYTVSIITKYYITGLKQLEWRKNSALDLLINKIYLNFRPKTHPKNLLMASAHTMLYHLRPASISTKSNVFALKSND